MCMFVCVFVCMFVYVCVCIQVSVEKLGGAEKIDEAELVIECWDYDFVSNDDLIGRSVFVRQREREREREGEIRRKR